jgi:hypothetical protein
MRLARILAACLLALTGRVGAAGALRLGDAALRIGGLDSAPLVPTNLLHSVAQYTSIPVAAQGTTVDLSSPELFRFPSST